MRSVPEWREVWRPRWRARAGEPIEGEYRLLTPLCGGGPEPWRADPVTVVRASSIKGQLRFWWRAVRGWQAGGSVEELKRLEDRIFGSAAGEEGHPSPITLEVEVLDRGEEVFPFEAVGSPTRRSHHQVVPPYVAFPLQAERGRPLRIGVRFRLRIHVPADPPDLRGELEAALWAWETFGGVGARTRRGCGAVVKQGAPVPTEEGIRRRLAAYAEEAGWPEGVPHLTPGSTFCLVPLSWHEVVRRYRDFRQARGASRDPRRPGRSLWPEPQAIRRLIRGTPATSAAAPAPPTVEKFPRAQFGLPIVFHFKDEDGLDSRLVERGAARGRLASPLIIRPVAERACLVAILEGPRVPPEGLELRWGEDDRKAASVSAELTPAEARAIPPLRGEVDPVKAFVMSLVEATHRGGRR